MRTLVIGSTGIIGSAVAAALEDGGHEVVRASRSDGIRVDMEKPGTIDTLFATVGEVDAVIAVAASGRLAPLLTATDEELFQGIEGKLLGQVRLVRKAVGYVRDGGSIILTSGNFTEPTPGASFGVLTNAGLDAFVRNAAIELPRGVRLNAVSPGWVRETLVKLGMDGDGGTPASVVARAYVELATGNATGRTVFPTALV
ncbi:short chain dehydrogenase [Streptomyces sp. NPDC051018]|uniref:short chain dehydrogenase n=1 Tax=Streptomyces sp. NPDC051018 TaxID=3365639 RepID=UPI003790F863